MEMKDKHDANQSMRTKAASITLAAAMGIASLNPVYVKAQEQNDQTQPTFYMHSNTPQDLDEIFRQHTYEEFFGTVSYCGLHNDASGQPEYYCHKLEVPEQNTTGRDRLGPIYGQMNHYFNVMGIGDDIRGDGRQGNIIDEEYAIIKTITQYLRDHQVKGEIVEKRITMEDARNGASGFIFLRNDANNQLEDILYVSPELLTNWNSYRGVADQGDTRNYLSKSSRDISEPIQDAQGRRVNYRAHIFFQPGDKIRVSVEYTNYINFKKDVEATRPDISVSPNPLECTVNKECVAVATGTDNQDPQLQYSVESKDVASRVIQDEAGANKAKVAFVPTQEGTFKADVFGTNNYGLSDIESLTINVKKSEVREEHAEDPEQPGAQPTPPPTAQPTAKPAPEKNWCEESKTNGVICTIGTALLIGAVYCAIEPNHCGINPESGDDDDDHGGSGGGSHRGGDDVN